MIGTDGMRNETGLSVQLTPWDAAGRASIAATAPDAVSALAGALSAVLDAIHGPGSTRPSSGRSASIRAEASDLPSLFAGLVDSLIGQIETLETDVAAVGIDGMVRSDRGLIAWGVAELTDGSGVSDLAVALSAPPLVSETVGTVTISAVLQRLDAGEA